MQKAELAVPSGAVPVMKTARLTIVTRSRAAVTSVRFILLVLLPSGEYYRWSLPVFNVASGWSPVTSLSAQTCPVDGWVVAFTTQTATTLIPKGTIFAFQFGLGAGDGAEVYRTVQVASDQGLEATWWAGKPNDPALFDPASPGAVFELAISVGTDGITSGNIAISIILGSGLRARVIGGDVSIDEAKAVHVEITDASGNILYTLEGNVTNVGSGGHQSFPVSNAQSSAALTNPGNQSPWFAGDMILKATFPAVSVSKTAVYGLILEVHGGTPTVSVTAPAGATTTTTTSKIASG